LSILTDFACSLKYIPFKYDYVNVIKTNDSGFSILSISVKQVSFNKLKSFILLVFKWLY